MLTTIEINVTAPRLPEKLAETITVWVSKKKINALRKYVHQLLNYKFEEIFPGNLGYRFEVRAFSGLNIYVYSDNEKLVKAYLTFRHKLLK